MQLNVLLRSGCSQNMTESQEPTSSALCLSPDAKKVMGALPLPSAFSQIFLKSKYVGDANGNNIAEVSMPVTGVQKAVYGHIYNVRNGGAHQNLRFYHSEGAALASHSATQLHNLKHFILYFSQSGQVGKLPGSLPTAEKCVHSRDCHNNTSTC